MGHNTGEGLADKRDYEVLGVERSASESVMKLPDL